MTDTTTFQIHPKTGRPIQPHTTFEVGDLVTEHLLGDGSPAVVVAVTPKTVWVQRVAFIGNFRQDDQPGYNGYGDSGTIAVDPDSIEEALAKGRDGAAKYVLYVHPRPTSGSLADQDIFGGTYHRSTWRRPGSSYQTLSQGAKYRRDPHV